MAAMATMPPTTPPAIGPALLLFLLLPAPVPLPPSLLVPVPLSVLPLFVAPDVPVAVGVPVGGGPMTKELVNCFGFWSAWSTHVFLTAAERVYCHLLA
jgi:hypothetical protein